MWSIFVIALGIASFSPLRAFAEGESPWQGIQADRYTPDLEELFKKWVSGSLRMKKSSIGLSGSMNGLRIVAIPTPNNDTYIGVLGWVKIQAPIQGVLSVLKDTGDYKNIYQDLQDLTVKTLNPSLYEIQWVFSGPMGTHTRYTTIQEVVDRGATSGLRYGLKQSSDVTAADGLILLESLSPTETLYLSIDFFNAHWGMIGSLFKGEIWKQTCDATARTTFEIARLAEGRVKDPKLAKVGFAKEDGYDKDRISSNCGEMGDRKKEKPLNELIADFFEPAPKASPETVPKK